MLTAHHIHKTFGIDTILEDVTFSIIRGERLGLIGPNGCGKTTLLRILVGVDRPDSGGIHLTPSDLRIGYLPQGIQFDAGETLGSYLARMEGDLPGLTSRLEQVAGELAINPDHQELQRCYDRLLGEIQIASDNEGLSERVLAGLGLAGLPGDLPADRLSGGQKTRLLLAGVLVSKPDLLVLDEPTNHLDIAMLEWLEDWLNAYPSAVLIVSHDRAFLDGTVTGILELDALTHTLRAYPGNYSDYLEAREAEREKQWQEFTNQQQEISRLKSASRHYRGIARFKPGGKSDGGDKFAKGFFANRSLETMQRAKSVEKRIEHLLTDDKVEKPPQTWQMKIEFGGITTSGRDVITMDDLTIGYGNNLLLRNLNATIRYGNRIVLTGPNGCGKTTLLRTLAGKLAPLAGRVRPGANVRIGYLTQEQEELDPTLNPLDTVRRMGMLNETEARSFLSLYLFKGDDVFTPAGKLSYGERARLSLACLVAQGFNFLMLDEPINHLDIPSRNRFEQSLSQFEGTILAVVHDRYFIQAFAREVWQMDAGKIQYHQSI